MFSRRIRMKHTAIASLVAFFLLMASTASAYTLDWAWDPEPRWLTGVDWGGSTFFGGIDRGAEFFGSTLLPSDYVDVEIHFDTSDTSLCATYLRPTYEWNGTGIFLGSAWDVSEPGNPRRLNICFVEWDESGIYDGLWGPDTTDVGGREYLYIMLSDYNEGVDYDDVNWGLGSDVLYGCWLRVPSDRVLYETDPAVLSLFYCDPSSVEPMTWGAVKRLYR
jgi:hypothetical protein